MALIFILFVKESRVNKEFDERKPPPLSIGLLQAVKDRNVMAISLVRIISAFQIGVRAFIPTYFVKELFMDTAQASFFYSVMVIGGIIGPFIWGYVSERFNRKKIVIVAAACSSVLFYLLAFLRSTVLLPLVLFLIGFMSQAVTLQSLLADYADPSFLDELFGLYFTLGFSVGSISSILFGFLAESFSFASAFTFISIAAAASVVPAFFIHERRLRSRRAW